MNLNTVRTTDPMIPSYKVTDSVAVVTADQRLVITDGTARTIASWWQSPGTVGRHLATLASGRHVAVDDLLDDIAATRRQADIDDVNDAALTCLRDWALRKTQS